MDCYTNNLCCEGTFGGTTATIVTQQRDKPYLYCGNVGDSAAVLGSFVDGRAVAVALTEVSCISCWSRVLPSDSKRSMLVDGQAFTLALT